MLGALMTLCVTSFSLGIWTNEINTTTSGFLLVVAAILTVGVAIVSTLKGQLSK